MCNECGGKGKKPGNEKEGGKPSTSKDDPGKTGAPSWKPQPLLNVMGNITGFHEKGGPVTKMKMNYTKDENQRPALNIDIDLVKENGSDEKFCLSSEPNKEELEERQHQRLRKIESELEGLMNKLKATKELRKAWNVQKEGLCNRKLKDLPTKPPQGPC